MKKSITNHTFKHTGKTLIAVLLLIITLDASAQNHWTRHIAEQSSLIEDVAYGQGKYVVIGDYAAIRTSSDGKKWEKQSTSLGDKGFLASIVFGAGQFVIAGSGGVILTSPNGIDWAKRNSQTTESLYNITFGAGVYVAVGYNGTIITSPDGANWTKRTSGTTKILNDVTFGGNNTFVIVGNDGFIATSSSNGEGWYKVTSGTTKTLTSVTRGKNANFAAVGRNGAILYSVGGYVWTTKFAPDPSISFTSVAFNPATGSFVAVDDSSKKAVTSVDGNYWGSPAIQTGSDLGFLRIRFVNNHFFAVGYHGEKRYSFTDGKTWYYPGVNTRKMTLNGVAYGNGQFVAVGNAPLDNGTTGLGASNVIYSSSDGDNFTVCETVHLVGGAKSFNDVTFGNGRFVAVGDDALIQTSTDGKNWTYSQVNFGQKLTGVAYGNGRYAAVGSKGVMLWSYDAKTWKKSDYLGISSFNGISYVNGIFVAVGPNGTLATSTDGNFWYFKAVGNNNNLTSVSFGGVKWMAVGSNGTVVTSTDGKNWKTKILNLKNTHFTDICHANGQFLMTTKDGLIYTLKNDIYTYVYSSNEQFNSITVAPGMFFAGGTKGYLITTPFDDGPTPEPESEKPDCGYCRTADADSTAEIESENVVEFNVVTYPNPVADQFSVDVEGATGGDVRMQLMDLSGRTIFDKVVNAESGTYRETVPMGQKQTGMYLLRVSTSTKTQTMKILKK
jgi:hypothetical protein